MKKKSIGSLALAGALVLGSAIPAFAADPIEVPEVGEGTTLDSVEAGANGQSVESVAEFTLPTISVTIPTTHGFIVNPYNLEDKGQIVSSEATISNASDVAVEVSLKTATATIEGAGTDAKKYATLGLVTAKTLTKTVELNLNVTAEEGKGTVHAPKTNITGKNTATKLVTLAKESGEAKLKYDGAVVANPTGNPWTDADKITVASVYVITPVVEPAAGE